jgi:chromosomal replication initiator protein
MNFLADIHPSFLLAPEGAAHGFAPQRREASPPEEASAAPAGSDAAAGGEPGEALSASPALLTHAWDEVLSVLQAELSGPTYNNYLRHIRPIALREGQFVLEVPSEFVKDWLVRRFARRIEETLSRFLGREILLSFQTGSVTPIREPGPPLPPSPSPQLVGQLADAPASPFPTTASVAETDALGAVDPGAQSDDAQNQAEPRPEEGTAPTLADEPEAKPSTLSLFAPETLPEPAAPAKQGRGNARAVREVSELEDFSSSPLNRKYTFDNFIVGRSNYVSHAAAWAVANAPAKGQYNPLFIYGGVGLGKTHLMQAIGHHINKLRNSPAEIVYVSGENFLYQVVRCIREDRMTAFRRMYRNVDIWLVDDIQYICNAERTEVEFFHIFNTLYDQGKQIVICSDKPPKDLQLTESRLISRFEWGLISYIEPPDLEHRIAILQKRAMAEGVHVEPAVLQFLAEKIRSNIRSLEGSLTRLLAMSSLDGRKINLDLAAETVRYYSTAEAEPVKVEVETIIQVVSEHYSMPVADILGKKRNKEIVGPRQVAMYLAREMAGMSYPDIGRAFGRDYTTVIHSFEKVRADVIKDSALRSTISDMRSRVHARS